MFYHGVPRAHIDTVGHVVCLTVFLPSGIVVRAGQYINVYMPTGSFWSPWQIHPFVVASARRHEGGMLLELMVEPRRGWTSKLAVRAREGDRTDSEQPSRRSYIVIFSGPHGHPIDVDMYGLVILVASGWGLMAQVPYLQHLIRGNNNSTTKARRIRLIWQLGHEGWLICSYQWLDAPRY